MEGLAKYSSAWLFVGSFAGFPSFSQPSLSKQVREGRVSRRICLEEIPFRSLQKTKSPKSNFRKTHRESKHRVVLVIIQILVAGSPTWCE